MPGRRGGRAGPAIDLAFRPITEADLPLLHRWMNAPHVADLWDGPQELDQVVAKYQARIDPGHHIRCYLALDAGRPFGFLQWYVIGDEPGYIPGGTELGLDPRAAGVDLYIGDPDHLHRGIGHGMLRRFVEDVVLPAGDVPYVVIDPDPENERAVRAFERAGFVPLAEVERGDERVLLMRLDPDHPGPSPA